MPAWIDHTLAPSMTADERLQEQIEGTSLNASPRTVAKNAASGYATLALGALLGFLVTPILLRSLGHEGFGVWALALGTIAYLGLLELGLSVATTTRVAALESSGSSALSRILSTALALCLVIAGVGAFVTVALAWLFPVLFDVPERLGAEARAAVLLLGGWQCLAFVVSVYSACLLGTGRMYLVNSRGFAVSSTVSVAQAALVLTGGGLIEIAAAQAVGGALTLAVFRREVRRHHPGVRITLRCADRSTAGRLLSLGWRNSISSISSTLAFGSDVVLVGLLLDPRAAAAYAVALRGYTLLQRLASGVAGALGPSHAHAARHESSERRFRIFALGIGVSLALATLAAGVVGTYASPLLDLWLGDVPGSSAAILVALCFVLVLHMPGLGAYSLLMNSEHAGELAKLTAAAAALNVMSSVLFTLALGAVGPALGSLTAVIIFDAFYMPHRVCRLLGRSYLDLAREAYRPLVVPSTVLAVVLIAGRSIVAEGPMILLVAAVAAIAYTVAWAIGGPARDVRRLLAAR